MVKKKKTIQKRKPVKKKPVKSTVKRKPRKRAKSNPTKKAPAKKERRKGLIGSAVAKVPEKVRIKGGKSKIKYGEYESESEYEDLEVGK